MNLRLAAADAPWLAVSALSGMAWGVVLAWLESSGAPLSVLVASALGGGVMGLLIRPYRHASDRTSLALLSLCAVYAAGAFSGGLAGLRELASGSASTSLATPFGDAFLACWALTLSGVFLALWPLAALNVVAVWRMQRARQSREERI